MSKLPYRAEYAKSGKAACKGCKELIENKSLRLAKMVQSSFFDGMQPNWFHVKCFFGRTKAVNVDEIEHFQNLRWEDQEEVKNRIASALGTNGTEKKKGGKRGAQDSSVPSDITDYTIEYAKSSRSKCRVCEEMIPKSAIRISKKDYDGEVAMKYGPVEQWHHCDCFVRAREELKFFSSGTCLPGYCALSPEDQNLIKTKIPKMKNDSAVPPPTKISKVEDNKLEAKMKTQNEALFKIRDELVTLKKKDLITLLEYNNQVVPVGVQEILDRLADLMTFGSLDECEKCKSTKLRFHSGVGYVCRGDFTEWAKCDAVYEKPKRKKFKVPDDLKEEYPFLDKYKPKTDDRCFVKSEEKQVVKSGQPALPLTGLQFLIHKTEKDVGELQEQIKKAGGSISKKFDDSLAAVIATESEVTRKKPLKVIASAKESNVSVLLEDFFDKITPTTSRDEIIKLFKEKTCSPWGGEIENKLAFDTVDGTKSVYKSKSATADKSKSLFKSDVTVKKFTLKDGLYVDPDSKLASKAHVYKQGADEIYSIVLSQTDLQRQTNSFYKLQLLEGDKKKKYWLFRSWGRIGTTIGGSLTEEYASLEDAMCKFEELFEEKTGNEWYERHDFQKRPGKFMLLDVVQGSEKSTEKLVVDDKCSLPKQVQELIALIFDIEAMKKTMMEFELDLVKMPLGKLSQKQLNAAFALLTDLQNLKESGAENAMIVDRTNRFYTLVPHDFGIQNPPLLDNTELIKQKIDMLNSLMDIEIAYNLLESVGDSSESPIEVHYKKLKTAITVLDKTSDEFSAIKKYVTNTHAKTHSNYKLVIEDVFKIKRDGESARYKAFKKLPNRMLLWHGSRVTNYAGILSQGLRIAPPEAPASGYMFGKGIYFADMVSKSANYCMTSSSNKTGLLLLCEVALGNMQELKQARDVKKPDSGKHSVKGVGRTEPDPTTTGVTPTGAVIPYGKGKKTSDSDTSLLYNEYIIYDVNQVEIQYLVRMTFKY